MQKQTKTPVAIRDVLRYFWAGLRYYKISFFYALFAYITAAILGLVSPIVYKRFFDVLTTASDKAALAPTLIHFVVIVLVIHIITWVLYRSGSLTVNNLEAKSMSRLREMSFSYMIDHSYAFFTNNFTGSLVQKVGRFTRAFEKLLDTLLYNLIPLIISTVGVIVVVWTQNRTIALVIVVWALAILAFGYFFSIWKMKYNVLAAAADSKSTGYLADAFTNQNAISSFAASRYESLGYHAVSMAQALATRLSWNLSEIMNATQGLLITIVEFLLFYFAIKFWMADKLSIGTFVLIQAYILTLAQQFWQFSNIIRTLYEGVADSKEMVEILQLQHEVQDKPGAKDMKIQQGGIEFKGVSFYFNDERKIIETLDFSIRPDEKVALIGPSGAGKSTIVKLLSRMYDIQSGEILIDGQNIREVTQESLRKNISLVPQDPVLFHRTLMENIRYGKLDATDEEVVEAARLAHCDEFIDVLPDKYNTFVGERGIKLSGGERQRVAIARAILKNAPILILDEATSSLDSHSESLIQDALDKLMKGKTVIVIAHRLSTIRKMDRIIVLEKGKIIEEGSHDELLSEKQSLYKNLWSLQAGGFLHE